MKYLGIPVFLSTPIGRRAVVGRTFAALLGLMVLAPILVLAEPTDGLFGHNHKAIRANTLSLAGKTYRAKPELTHEMFALSFATLLRDYPDWVPGGLFSDSTAELSGGANLPVKMWREGNLAGHRVYLSVGDQTADTGLTDDQARALILWVDYGRHALASLGRHPDNDPNPPFPFKAARLGYGYVDTQDGYDLLWCDTICSFEGVPKVAGKSRSLTIVDAASSVMIDVRDGLKIQGGEPVVAYWQRGDTGQGEIIEYRTLDDAAVVITRQDQQSLATLRRVFKWAPIARLARKSDPNAFNALVAELRGVTPERVPTPRFLYQVAPR
jgi:hypothetical protein